MPGRETSLSHTPQVRYRPDRNEANAGRQYCDETNKRFRNEINAPQDQSIPESRTRVNGRTKQLVTHPDKAKSNRFVRVDTLGLERAPQALEVPSMLIPSCPGVAVASS